MTPELPGYRVGELVRRSSQTAVYRAIREHDDLPVVAKFHSTFTGAGESAHFEHEYRLLSKLQVRGAERAIDLIRRGNQHILVLEHLPGIDLRRFMAGKPLAIETFLTIALRINRILAGAHDQRVIHRDLKPSSILVNPESLEIGLADFGFSVVLEHSLRRIYDAGVLRRILPYISPEQTGRTAHGVDRRSDLYSLGMTFYELLTGRLPFEAQDPLAWVHAHLARHPLPLCKLRPEIPTSLSEVVARLAAKDPADRYQSAHGLLRDLELCRDQLAIGDFEPFALGSADLPDTPRLPARLYGREKEKAELLEALEAAHEGVELLLVRGAAGIGKTALVNELHGPLAGLGGLIAVGKFEQHGRDVPLLGLRRALDSLAEQLLAEDVARMEARRRLIFDSLGPLTNVLVELVPKLADLLGRQNPSTAIGPMESRNRLLLAVQRLLIAIACPAHPLVLFLDDLQWSDHGTERLLKELMAQHEARGLLIIGAVREDDSDAIPALAELPEYLSGNGRSPRLITLQPLRLPAVGEMLADALGLEAGRARWLAGAFAGRTDNNPLLIRQLLLHTVDEGRIRRSPNGWGWDDDAVLGAGIPEDSVAMVRAKVGRLPSELGEVLEAASCVGSRFDLLHLAAALEGEPVELLPLLSALCEEGLLATAGDGRYRFSHDRIEEAAASVVDPERARGYHGRIGQYLRRTTSESSLGERLFEIVKHLNEWLPQATDPEVLLDLARLDHLAGQKAIRAAAYSMAERFLTAGIRALEASEMTGESVRDIELALRIDHARSFSFSGKASESEALFDRLLGRDLTSLEGARVCAARVEVLSLDGSRFEEAVHWGLRGLARCGLSLPRRPSLLRLSLLRLKLWRCFRGDIRQRLQALPPCSDPRALLRAELSARLVVPAYLLGGSLYPTLMIHQALHVLRFGPSRHCFHPLSGAAGQLAVVLGNYRAGEDMVRQAMAMSRGASTWCRATMGAHHSVLPWVQPYRQCLEEVTAASEIGSEEGDVEFVGFALISCTTFAVVSGAPLSEVRRLAEKADLYLTSSGMTELVNRQQGLLPLCDVLSGLLEPSDLDDSLDARGAASTMSEILWRMKLNIFFGRPEIAWELGQNAAERAERVFFSTHYYAEFVFYLGLSAAWLAEEKRYLQSIERRRTLAKTLRRYRKWACVCAPNFAHKALFLEAERERLRRRPLEALKRYEEAAEAARTHGFVHLQALVCERLARYVQSLGWHHLAEGPLIRARDAYATWGADRKVALLEKECSPLLAVSAEGELVESASMAEGPLDLASLLQTSQAISEEIQVDAVVERVMTAAITNAGAQRGVLLLAFDGKPGMVAELQTDQAIIWHEPALELESCRECLALSVVRLTARTGESQVIADAHEDDRWKADPYIAKAGIRSLACFPILGRGKRSGFLYLENTLATGVFTSARADLLRVLTAQAAISLENARMYEEQSHRVKILSGLLPICSSCKKIRDDAGYWNQLEVYLDQHTEARFSHGLCPGCFDEIASEMGMSTAKAAE